MLYIILQTIPECYVSVHNILPTRTILVKTKSLFQPPIKLFELLFGILIWDIIDVMRCVCVCVCVCRNNFRRTCVAVPRKPTCTKRSVHSAYKSCLILSSPHPAFKHVSLRTALQTDEGGHAELHFQCPT